MEDMKVREIPLFLREERDALISFLAAHSLHFEEDVDCAYGLYSEDTLVGCGCAAGQLLKCFAIDSELRGYNCLSLLLARLCMNRFSKGMQDLFIITRGYNVPKFSRCGFTTVTEAAGIALMENRRDGVKCYLDTLPAAPAGCRDVGAIVMNGNPPTNGHLALIRYAAQQCGFLYLFVVEEDRSAFPFADRLALIRTLASPFPNVYVCPSGPYMISGQTFPTYFLKEDERPSLLQSELDVTLFAERIAPALKITKRFAGTEPSDPVTRTYNNVMRRLLPEHGIAFCEIERACCGGRPISATEVRRLLGEAADEQAWERLEDLLPPCTLAYLRKKRTEGAAR